MDATRETLQHSAAVRQLQQGCARLGLHADVAVELVCFLNLRLRFARPISGEEPQGLSPGSQLDQLWHWMLLNTQVAREVYHVVGGEVDHASTDEEDLSDDTKVVRRLAALNLLAGKGWTPNLAFWEEPGTMLHSLERITYGPGQVPLYVPPGAAVELCNTLEQLVDQPDNFLSPAWTHRGPPHVPEGRVFADAEANNTAEEPLPPAKVNLVFHLRPGQQATLPHLQGGTLVSVPCDPHATVGDLYTGAAWYLSPHQDPTQPELAAAAAQLRLVHGTTHYGNLGSSLLLAGMGQGHVLHVLQMGQELPPSFSISIRTLIGLSFSLLAHAEMLVLELKQVITRHEGIPPTSSAPSSTAGSWRTTAPLGRAGCRRGLCCTLSCA